MIKKKSFTVIFFFKFVTKFIMLFLIWFIFESKLTIWKFIVSECVDFNLYDCINFLCLHIKMAIVSLFPPKKSYKHTAYLRCCKTYFSRHGFDKTISNFFVSSFYEEKKKMII